MINRLFFLLLVISLSFVGCKSAMENTVRNGFFDACPTSSIEDLVDNYFQSPQWESFIADDGNFYVNVSGGITYDNKPANALLQFYVDGNRFQVNAFEINKAAQNDYMVLELIADMCNVSNGTSTSTENYSNNSIDGTYVYDENYGKCEITISGDSWYGITIIKSGFGDAYDSENASYDNGVINGSDLYDETGYVKVGNVSGNKIYSSIGGQSITLYNQ